MTQFIQKKTHFFQNYKLYSLLLLWDIKYWYWFSLPWIYVCCKLSMISHRANTLHRLSVSLFLRLVYHFFCPLTINIKKHPMTQFCKFSNVSKSFQFYKKYFQIPPRSCWETRHFSWNILTTGSVLEFHKNGNRQVSERAS